ncbi:CBS domain-containing protein [Tissierella creatinophila]|uniref:Hypoxic response protein 1 n=1 Tax=Tissierella creatinophila DSM 6911 TaxID=1123403 RepID=A0A1U7M3N7_TISCR|nr:CBS domain-containing protein [Tissierella creatinophila]OLS01895.1 hypoxic response protein 1 [Tissierella creatinophila DSM 6911]
MYIKDIMTKDVITVHEEDTVEKCANLLITHDLSGIPVVDDKGKVKGIVTEGDLIRRASRIEGPPVLEVLGGLFYLESPKKFIDKLKKSMGSIAREIMTENVITVGPDKEIEDAATLLVQEKIKRLPVVDKEGNLIGIVSRKDIMNYLFNPDYLK